MLMVASGMDTGREVGARKRRTAQVSSRLRGRRSRSSCEVTWALGLGRMAVCIEKLTKAGGAAGGGGLGN